MVTDVREVQWWNAISLMVVTESGIVTDLREEHSENAPFPMDVTELPMVTDVREVQWWNAISLMVVTESGMVTVASFEHPSNAEDPMDVRLSVNTTHSNC